MSAPSAAARSPAPSAREVPSAQIASAAITSEPSSSPGASAPQVPTRIARRAPSAISSCEHDRGGGAAHPGRLDRERLAVGGGAGVAPQAAVVVEHAGLLQQRLGQHQRPAGVAGEQHPLGQGGGRAQVQGLAGRQGRDSRLDGRWGIADALIATMSGPLSADDPVDGAGELTLEQVAARRRGLAGDGQALGRAGARARLRRALDPGRRGLRAGRRPAARARALARADQARQRQRPARDRPDREPPAPHRGPLHAAEVARDTGLQAEHDRAHPGRDRARDAAARSR